MFYTIVEDLDDINDCIAGCHFETPLSNFCNDPDQKQNVLYIAAAAYDGFRKICVDHSKLILSDACVHDFFHNIDIDDAWNDFQVALNEFWNNHKSINVKCPFDNIIAQPSFGTDILRALIILGISDSYKELYDVFEIIKSNKPDKEKKKLGKTYNDFTFTVNNPLIGFSSRHAGGEANEGQRENLDKKKISLKTAKKQICGLLREEINQLYGYSLTEAADSQVNYDITEEFIKTLKI